MSNKSEKNEEVRRLEEKISLIDDKIIFLFKRIKELSNSINILVDQKIAPPVEPRVERYRQKEPVTTPIVPIEPEPLPPPVEIDIVPETVVKAEPLPVSFEMPVTPIRETPKAEMVEKKKKIKVSLRKKVFKEENIPYYMLLAFYILLAVLVYLGTDLILREYQDIFSPLAVFLTIGGISLVFILVSFIVKKWLTAKNRERYSIFPWSFLGIGIAGILVSFILSQTVVEGAPQSEIIFPLTIVGIIIAFVVAILFKNEFLTGEASFALIFILLVPTLFEPTLLGEFSGYVYFAFFMAFIIGAYILAKLKITAAPSLVSLVSFPILGFIPAVYEVIELETLLVIIPSCLVATLLVEKAYDKFSIYNRREMRTVITIVALVLPLACYIYLLFIRELAEIPSWEIFISTLFIVATYFLTIKQILSAQLEEYDIRSPVLLEIGFVALINLIILLSLISEILVDQGYVFLGLYLIVQISFALLSMIWKIEKTTSRITQSIVSMLFVEGAFITFFSSASSFESALIYEIILSIGLSYLFLAPLIALFVLRKQKHVMFSSLNILLLGAINLFVMSFFGLGSISRSICELFIIVISIIFGIISVLETLNKISFPSSTEKINFSHLHAISILGLTSSLWYIQVDEILNYFVVAGIFVSIALWISLKFLKRKKEKHWSEDIFGLIAIAPILLAIPASISNVSTTLAIITTFCSVAALAALPIVTKNYNLSYPFLIYTVQIVSLFAFPNVTTIYGADWLIPVVFLIPTLSLLTVSITDKRWLTRIGTTVLATITLILSAYRLQGTDLGLLIAISSIVLISCPILIYLYNSWRNKEDIQLKISIEYPIDLFLTTLGAIIASSFVRISIASEILNFSFLILGTVIGPICYIFMQFIGRSDAITKKIKLLISTTFVAAIQILLLAAGSAQLITNYYYIALLISTTLVASVIIYKEKFDTLVVVPALVSVLFVPLISTLFSPSINSWFSFSVFIIFVALLSVGWARSKYPIATFAAFFIVCLGFVLSAFTETMSFFVDAPDYIAMLVFALWLIGITVSIALSKLKPENNVENYLVWLFAITLICISISIPSFWPSMPLSYLYGITLTTIPAVLSFIVFSTYVQYKMKYSYSKIIIHIIPIQIVIIVVGSLLSSSINYSTPIAEILTYIFFNVFTILVFIILESLVVEYTLVKTDSHGSEIANIVLFVPIYIFSIIISTIFNYYGIVPLILGIVFYGMSQRHKMKISSIIAVISIGISAFFVTPVNEVMSWQAFGIVSTIATLMIITGILLYLKTKNEFHIITTISVALLGELIIGFLSPLVLPLQFGLAFNLALLGLLLGVIFNVKEFTKIFSVLSGLILIPYIVISIAMREEFGYFSLLFLISGILLLLASYLIYNSKRETNEIGKIKETEKAIKENK
ncbi:MAG: hypothetical protein ACTSQC_04390 [Candidatus Heimdallarchaeaceae archaeon]